MEDNGYKYVYKNDSIRYKTKFLKKLFDRFDTKECNEIRRFLYCVQQITTRI